MLATLYNSLRHGGNTPTGFLLIVFTLLTIVCVEIRTVLWIAGWSGSAPWPRRAVGQADG